MITSLDGGTAQYRYAAAGRRVSKITAAETVHYAFGAEHSTATGWKRVFVSAGGIKAQYRDNQTYFHSRPSGNAPGEDGLGRQSDRDVVPWSHYPFGEQWEQTGPGDKTHRFTGHRRIMN